MTLSGEIITAFVAALGTVATTVALVGYLLRDLRTEVTELRTELRTEMRDVRSELRDLRSETRQVFVELLHHVQSGHNPPPSHAA